MAHVNPAQIQKFLGDLDYPADKRQLLEHAKEKGADEDVIQTLEQMPMDRFNSPNDVSEAIGRIM